MAHAPINGAPMSTCLFAHRLLASCMVCLSTPHCGHMHVSVADMQNYLMAHTIRPPRLHLRTAPVQCCAKVFDVGPALDRRCVCGCIKCGNQTTEGRFTAGHTICFTFSRRVSTHASPLIHSCALSLWHFSCVSCRKYHQSTPLIHRCYSGWRSRSQ